MPQIDPAFAVKNATARACLRATASQRGQGMTEYIIIVALIAVAAIGVYQFFGQVVRSQVAAIAHEVSGTDGTASTTAAKTAATGASTQEAKRGLANFSGGAISASTAAAPQ